MSCLQAENQGVKCACFLQHKIFTTYIIGIFCGCVSWRQLFYTIIIFCCSVWRCEKWDRCFYGCVWVWRDSSCVEQVPSLFYQNKCSPSQLTHDAHLSDVTVLPANQSELRSFSCAAMLQWEERGNPLSTLGCADAEFFLCWVFSMLSRCRMSSVTLASFWRALNWCKGYIFGHKDTVFYLYSESVADQMVSWVNVFE